MNKQIKKDLKKENTYWFKAKNYGWGWYPCSWQGWLVLLIWIILFTFGIIKMENEWLKNLLFNLVLVGILIWICYKKGEKPRWRWGKNIKKTMCHPALK